MTVRDYIEVLIRRKWVIIITFLSVLGLSIVITLMTTPKYRASTTVRVLALTGGGGDWVTFDSKQIERLMSTYAEFATSRPVIIELVERLGLSERPGIEVELLIGTELMKITAEALDPVAARDAANTLTEILIDESRALYLGSGKSAQEILGEQLAQVRAELDEAWTEYENVVTESPEDAEGIAAASRLIELKEGTYAALLDQYERLRVRDAVLANTLSIVEPAVAPGRPSKPRTQLNLALGVVVGLAAGIGLAFLIESLDTTLYATDQIKRAAELSVLGQVPSGGRQERPPLFNGNSPQGEAFRHLRTSLLSLDNDRPLKTLLVTSAEPREGKSTVTANLGVAFARAGREVVIVDAHLRLPTLHQVFDLSNRLGLSSVLEGKATLAEALQKTEIPGVSVLTSGPLPANPAELVSSPRMADLVEQLARESDMVLLDTPSVLVVTDAAALSGNADGVMLVAERGHAHQESVRAARQQLTDIKANPIGVVVNRAEHNGMYDYYGRLST